ncbi:ECF RNA polymerase sigma factor SigK [Kitasatospora sp. NPDC057223]|uniref:ECF RNA polymerase sigma factor SigK n=1 Tax=Kitasatospora sp. NPDC057223 TaxID=3346055 RepID=UPI00362D3473
MMKSLPPAEASARLGSAGPVTAAEELKRLADLVGRGDEPAYTRLYGMVAGPVYGLVLRILRDPAQSEEVAQEVLLEVWRAAAGYRSERGSVLTWVLTIAHRRAVDRVRATQATSDRERRFIREDAPVPVDSVSEEVERTVDRERVRVALAGLTEVQREALVLAYFGGFTQVQIAQLLCVPLGTVKTRTRDGLGRLRDELRSVP